MKNQTMEDKLNQMDLVAVTKHLNGEPHPEAVENFKEVAPYILKNKDRFLNMFRRDNG